MFLANKNNNTNKNVLIISLALNGYQYLYRPLLNSHQAYASKMGFDHWLISKPVSTRLGIECAWVKLLLIQTALDQGYQWVMFLDADTQVQTQCPDFRLLRQKNKCLYLANGYSNNVNSGVMIIHNCRQAQRFIWQVLNHKSQANDFIDPVGWGENGHIIACAKNFSGLAIIDQRWNNNHQTELDDYIRHYSYGPLKQDFKATMHDKAAYACLHYSLAVYKRVLALSGLLSTTTNHSQANWNMHLQQLYCRIQQRYPQLASTAPPSLKQGEL